jgi:hypothetical protein
MRAQMLGAAAVARVLAAEMKGADSGLMDLFTNASTFNTLLKLAQAPLPVKMVRPPVLSASVVLRPAPS